MTRKRRTSYAIRWANLLGAIAAAGLAMLAITGAMWAVGIR